LPDPIPSVSVSNIEDEFIKFICNNKQHSRDALSFNDFILNYQSKDPPRSSFLMPRLVIATGICIAS